MVAAAERLLPDEDARTCFLFVPPPRVNKNPHYKQLAWLVGGGEEGVVKIAFSGVRQHQDCVYRYPQDCVYMRRRWRGQDTTTGPSHPAVEQLPPKSAR